MTLQPLRQRINVSTVDFNLPSPDTANETVDEVESHEVENSDWTTIDWGILVVKFLVWVCLQVGT